MVWHELRQLGAAPLEAGLAAEAQLVCDEMARRARQNIEVIVERLTEAGYRFHRNDDEETPAKPFVPATETSAQHALWLRERFGAVPMTLLSWVRLVGAVWLVGTHPDWPESSAADPLVLDAEGLRYGEPIRDYYDEIWQAHLEDDRPGLFVLPLAPDRLHKSNTSGGGPYGMILPDGGVEGVFAGEVDMPFVSYLNWVFSHGGFPWPSGNRAQWRVVHRLKRDLLPL
ncbi:hypothetical protein [Dactylosporangium darangshiense]|uniref:Uncharacterized protein n=1 Tax=Dactylosporangium darangshiense TaxID=579108 RepID=A0ABP8DQY1_9ACTN